MNGKNRYSLLLKNSLHGSRDGDGVIEVALFGSAASDKPNPQDFDLMVFIKDISCIPRISKSIRKTTNIFHAHDVFIFHENKKYLGRICQRSVCPTTSVECYIKDCEIALQDFFPVLDHAKELSDSIAVFIILKKSLRDELKLDDTIRIERIWKQSCFCCLYLY